MAFYVGPDGTVHTSRGTGTFNWPKNRPDNSDRMFNYRTSGGAMAGLTGGWIGSRSSRHFRMMGGSIGRAIGGYEPSYFQASRLTPLKNPGVRTRKVGNRRIKTYYRSGLSRAEGAKQEYKVAGRSALETQQRLAYMAKADTHLWKGLKALPIKTKIGLPLAAAGIYGWMHRSNRDNFYTHYYDF